MRTMTLEKKNERRPRTDRYSNSIDFWRRRRGYTWDALAEAIGSKSPCLIRAAQTLYNPHPNGGGIGRRRMAKLAEVLQVELWQLYVPAEDAEKNFDEI